jgi:hypothetical protein
LKRFIYFFAEKERRALLIEAEEPTSARGNRRKRKSLTELFLCLVPFSLYQLIGSQAVLYVLDEDMPFLLISGVPKEWRNPAAYAICLFVDTLALLVYLSAVHFVVYSILIFIWTVNEELEVASYDLG